MIKKIYKKFVFWLLLGAFLLSVTALLLFWGVIRFNYPDKKRFPVQGLDVSNHQGKIQWNLVKMAGIDFVYIKATEGGDFVDKSFAYNWRQAKKQGIYTGAYHYFTLCKPGKLQAANFIAVVPKEPHSLPPALDLEYTGNCRVSSYISNFDREVGEFIRIVKKHYGKEPIIYTTYEFRKKYGLSRYKNPLWIRDIFRKPGGQIHWSFWQYTNRLKIAGIQGYVDGNVFYASRKNFLLLTSGGVMKMEK